MWDVRNFEYGSPGKTDMSGANLFYANKYDEVYDTWLPFGECPFCFYDPDQDGYSEIAIRMVAAPMTSVDGRDVDYGNNVLRRLAPTTPAMRELGLVSVRYSFALQGTQRPDSPYAYEVGLTMSGVTPYPLACSATTDRERRQPSTTFHIPWEDAESTARSYPADTTALSWDEAGVNNRWEGIFWIWERRIGQNTGGTTIKYDIRREYDGDPSSVRSLYYSEVDKRFHLYGAEEGWIEISVGLKGKERLGEIRFFDTTGDGFFDRWEVDLDGDCIPERTASVADGNAELIPWEYSVLKERYADRLPWAIDENLALIEGMRAIVDDQSPYADQIRSLEALLLEGLGLSKRRYCLDLLREYYYQVIVYWLSSMERDLVPPTYGAGDKYDSELLEASMVAWRFADWRTRFQIAYERGRFDDAALLLRGLVDLSGQGHPLGG